MQKHFNIRVYGKVHGVFFRASAAEQAKLGGISGFALNEPEGSVYIEAEGDDTMLAHFLEWCGKGPSKAVVDRIEIIEAELSRFSGFEIRR
ncbi:MAG: acylphosphatase [Bacteroidia bacterium]